VVGAAPEAGSLGGGVLGNLGRFGFTGTIHPVTRSHKEIDGRPCVAAIDELPMGIDVAALVVPQAAVQDAVAACARRGIGAAAIFAAGFGEVGPAGLAAQDAVVRTARAGNVALIGPNCIGYVNFADSVAVTFEPVTPLPAGATERPMVGVVAQSGAMSSTLRIALLAKELGISCTVSTGNEADLATEDFLEFLIDDPRTRVIVLFVEQFRHPQRFLELAGRARGLGKPIVLMHPGRSARAQASARSHTGAMAGDHAVMTTLVRHQGVLLVETLEELIDTAELLTRLPAAPSKGAAVMTNSGAFKGYTLDFAETIGLPLPALSPATAEALAPVLPAFASVDNPLDVTAQAMRDPGLLGKSAGLLLADPAMGSLIVAVIPGPPRHATDKARAVAAGIANSKKPVVFAALGDEAPLPPDFISTVRGAGMPFFRSPERALRAMARATEYGQMLAARHSTDTVSVPKVALPGTGTLPEYQGKAVLTKLDIAVPRGALVRDVAAAKAAARKLGYPVVIKAQSADLPHKSDVGGVIVGIKDDTALTEAWDRLHASVGRARPDLALDGVLVETMGASGLEMVIGARRDPSWGPVVMVGLGGIWIEALKDVRLLPAEISAAAAREEILKLRGAALLQGLRGAPPADIDALAALVARLGAFMRVHPQVAELDINPLVVYPQGQGVLALDVLLVVS
jgi:acetate---CoA ligase (ADP-forming)